MVINKQYVVSLLTLLFAILVLVVSLYTLLLVNSLKGEFQPRVSFIAEPPAEVVVSPAPAVSEKASVSAPLLPKKAVK